MNLNKFSSFLIKKLNNYVTNRYLAMSSNIKDTDLTVHSAHIDDVYEMPIDQIIRPLPSILDECKVDSLMKTLQVRVYKIINKNKNSYFILTDFVKFELSLMIFF